MESVKFINDKIIIEGHDYFKIISAFKIYSLVFKYDVGEFTILINDDFSITLNEWEYTESDARTLFDEIKQRVILVNTPMMKYQAPNPKT